MKLVHERTKFYKPLALGNSVEDMEQFGRICTNFGGQSQTFMDMVCLLKELSCCTSYNFLQVEILVVDICYCVK